MANSIPRAEHPNPQFERESWLNLNGEWEFEIDNSVSGRERGLQNAERFLCVGNAVEHRMRHVLVIFGDEKTHETERAELCGFRRLFGTDE